MLKAIETKYKGYRFRSRLEARWAVFFDAMGYRWRYENEGYELPSGYYLPDFIVNEKTFVEIKGKEPEHIDRQLCFELADASGWNVLLLSGNIGYSRCECWHVKEFKSEYFSGFRPGS